MKKILLLLVLAMLLACSEAEEDDPQPYIFDSTGGETVEDGIEWYDVVEPLLVGDSGGYGGGTSIVLSSYDIEGDVSNYIAMIEFDDAKNYVGAERGRILEGQQQYVQSYSFDIKSGYTIHVTKGDNITDEQFERATSSYSGEDVYWDSSLSSNELFSFFLMTGYETIPINTVLAHLEVYKSDDMSKPLGTFHIVL